ncbi:MAG: TIGR00282 family metallophosphoesterase [Planctomycetota bacterium]
MKIKIMAIGDVVGTPGRDALKGWLKKAKREQEIEFAVVNGENIAGGSGLTPSLYEDLLIAGADAITSGDHIFKKKEIIPLLTNGCRIVRPCNYPDAAAGLGWQVFESRNGFKIGVAQVQGRVFMNTPADNPFLAAERAVEALRQHTNVVVLDVHAEATSEKVALGWMLDGRVSLLFGTHTHIPTADETVLPKGTAFISDVGMTGPYDSILGRDKDKVLRHFVTGMPMPFDVASNDVRISGCVATVDLDSGRALACDRFQVRVGA